MIPLLLPPSSKVRILLISTRDRNVKREREEKREEDGARMREEKREEDGERMREKKERKKQTF